MNQPGRVVSPSPVRDTPVASDGWPFSAVFAVLLLACLLVYFPSLRGAFLWDDSGHVTSPALQGWAGLWRIWFEPGVTQQYYPLLHSAFWIEHRLWGDATLGYHLVNVLWHATSACLLVAVLRRLKVPGALLAGLLFALHPICVESVAWISEQKNTLSSLLYLAAALAWLRFEDERRPARYVIATAFFVAALLSKTVTATLPAALLVVAWWRRGRLSWRNDVVPLVPWFTFGIGTGLFTAWFERTGIGAQGTEFDLSLIDRVLIAGRVFWFYLTKLLWPADLMFFYPRWHVDASAPLQYLFPGAAVALFAVLLWRASHGKDRGVTAAFLLFGGTLFPVLGFLNVYPFVFSYVADHFQYLASPSMFALTAAEFVTAMQRVQFGQSRAAVQTIAALIVVGLAALSWNQDREYVDPITLYRATLAHNRDSWVAHHNLASELAAHGELDEALQHAQRAVELKPDYPEALNNLAVDLTHAGRAAEALGYAKRAVELQPRYADAENTWGIALITLGNFDEAVRHFQRAITLDPRLADAHYNLGLANAQRGNFLTAIPQFAETIRLKPEHVGAELNIGIALALSEGLAKARPHLDRAVTLDPESAVLRHTYGRVLLNAGDFAAAEDQFREALRLDPNLPDAQRELAFARQRLGRTE